MSPELIKCIKSDNDIKNIDIDKTNIFSLGIICLKVLIYLH